MINESVISTVKDSLLSLANHHKSLLESGKYSDVILVVGGKQFKSHKYILAARSPVFAAMFEHDCIEKQESMVNITDVPLDVFEEFLRYIYSATTPDLKQFASELLPVADKVC